MAGALAHNPSSIISQIFDPEGRNLRVKENIAYRLVCVITVPYHYAKMVAEFACGFFLGVAALLFACQSKLLNDFTIGMFRRSGDSFTKIGLNVCGFFAPNWAFKQSAVVGVRAMNRTSTYFI